MSKQIGLDLKLYWDDGGGWETESWEEISDVRDLTKTDTMSEADVSRRASRNKQTEPALRDITIEWEMIHDPSDANYCAIRDAYDTGDAIILALADADITSDGTEFLAVQCQIFKFERSEPLEGANTYAVMAAPCWPGNVREDTIEVSA